MRKTTAAIAAATPTALTPVKGAPQQAKTGLLFNEKLRVDFDTLKASIKTGGM